MWHQLIRYAVLLATLVLVIAHESSANLILNGNFESNSASMTMYNMSNTTFNAVVPNATAFGSGQEIDLITFGGFGLAPASGNWKMAIHCCDSVGGGSDAFALHLSAPITTGQSYVLDFFASAEQTFDPGLGPVEIGISSSATSFGTLFFQTSNSLSTTSWDHVTQTLVAPVSGSFLTVRLAQSIDTWAHIDNFSLNAVPEPGSLIILAVGALVLVRHRGHPRHFAVSTLTSPANSSL